jgi:hypothetical protein
MALGHTTGFEYVRDEDSILARSYVINNVAWGTRRRCRGDSLSHLPKLMIAANASELGNLERRKPLTSCCETPDRR